MSAGEAPVSASELPESVLREVPVRWTGVDAVPIQMANQFLVQVDTVEGRPDQLILAIGQVTPPPVLGTLEQKVAAAQAISEVSIHTIARYSITPARLRELVTLLQRIGEQAFPIDEGSEAAT